MQKQTVLKYKAAIFFLLSYLQTKAYVMGWIVILISNYSNLSEYKCCLNVRLLVSQ